MTFIEIIFAVVGITVVVTVVTLFLNRKEIPNINSDNEVVCILQSGDKLKAIKAYRQLHGVGLKQAKMFIDNCIKTSEKE